MTGPGSRRQNLTPEEVEQMKSMEAEGKSRKQIADAMDCTPASVTRRLGAVRAYKGLRSKVEEVEN